MSNCSRFVFWIMYLFVILQTWIKFQNRWNKKSRYETIYEKLVIIMQGKQICRYLSQLSLPKKVMLPLKGKYIISFQPIQVLKYVTCNSWYGCSFDCLYFSYNGNSTVLNTKIFEFLLVFNICMHES